MTEPFIFLRTVVPMVVAFICAVALGFLHERIKPPERGFLIWFWGGLGLVFLEAAVVSFFLRLAEPATIAAGNAGFNAVLGVIAALLLALTVVLGRRIRVQGQPMLSVLFRPPPGLTPRALRGWGRAFVPVVTLFFAIGMGASAGTYALTS
jgi:hypothetical protein